MNILFLSITSIDSIEEKGIYTDLLRQFRDNGHTIYIVSSREKRFNKQTEYVVENTVHTLKVRIGNITETNIVEKGISTLLVERQYLSAIKKYMKNIKFDLVIYTTPPITFEKIIRIIKKRNHAKSYLLLKDIFPQNAIDIELFGKKSIIYKYFRFKEKRLYQVSDYIGCMSQANVNYILQNNPEIPSSKIEICPNSIEPTEIKKMDTQTHLLRNKFKIPLDKTIFIYGGNLGKPQGIDFFINCIKSNQHNDQAFFVIVGSGTELNKLRRFIDSEKPKNAILLQQLPKDEYEMLANSCDVGLIFLDYRFTIPNFPSRLLSYMNASIPVLAATDKNTDIGKVIEHGKFGYWCESKDVDQFNEKVKLLCNRKHRNELGLNARRYLEQHYTARHSYEIIVKHFEMR